MTDPLQAIIELLRDQHGIPPKKLYPSARLGHDLGVDGDDASDLLQTLHERFGTDFSALDESWTEFFHNEGASPYSIMFGFLLIMSSTAFTVWIATTLKLSTGFVCAIGVAMFFAFWIVLGRIFPGRRKRPVTIEGLADIIQVGSWPTDPAKVH